MNIPFYAVMGVTEVTQPLYFTSKAQSAKFAKTTAENMNMSLAVVKADKDSAGCIQILKPLQYVYVAACDRKTNKVRGTWASKTDERG